jgi:predicted GH43/DUF377 family glycosyl hydrolase
MTQPQFLQTLQRSKSNPLLTIDDITWDYKKKRSIMFPSVIDMSDKLETPIDRYYMYLASHGGREIGFATAPDLKGPWTIQNNPVLHLDNCPAVTGHLSSPEIIYYNNRFILYYHGNCPDEVLEEQNRRMPTYFYRRIQNSGAATSTDGIHFDVHPNPLLLPITTPDHWRVATNMYLRVIATETGCHGFFMTMSRKQADYNDITKKLPENQRNSRPHPTCIGHAWSPDGLDWTLDETGPTLIAEETYGEYSRIRHIGLTRIDETHVLATYSCSAYTEKTHENIFAATLKIDGQNVRLVEKHGAILSPEQDWESNNLRDPFPIFHDEKLYLYYAGGREHGIGLAVSG